MGINKLSIILLLVISLSGYLESSFVLSPDSRVPKWFTIPNGKHRSEFKITADYYSTFDGAKAVFKLYEENHFFPLQKVIASTKTGNWSKKSSTQRTRNGYPRYKAITINGITDIIEHRKMEPIFYITDDPAIWSELVNN